MSEGFFQGDPTVRPIGGGMYRLVWKDYGASLQFERQTKASRQRAGRKAGDVSKAMALVRRLGL